MATKDRVVTTFRRVSRSPKRHILSGNIAFTPALMSYGNTWVRTQVYWKKSTGGKVSYLCPFCVSERHAFELGTTKDIGDIRLNRKVIELKARLVSHRCPNEACRRRYIILKGKNEVPKDFDSFPYVDVP